MARLEITPQEIEYIFDATEKGNFIALEKIVRKVAEKTDVSEGAVVASVRSKKRDGATALHMAVKIGHSLEYFVDRQDKLFGGQPNLNYEIFNQRDNNGMNAALLACRHDSIPYLDFVVKMQSSITALDFQGWTAVHHAARHNAHLIITQLVSDYGLAPDAVAYGGKTPAHIAAEFDHLEAFKALFLAEGGCEFGPDYTGLTPIDIAFKHGSAKILRYLYTLGMGTGRAIPEEVERKSVQDMKKIWEMQVGWNVCMEWIEGVPDGLPRRINLRQQWEAEQFPEEQQANAKRRRLE